MLLAALGEMQKISSFEVCFRFGRSIGSITSCCEGAAEIDPSRSSEAGCNF